MKRRFSEPGFVVSLVVHVAALGATLVAFSQTQKFDDLQETVPVEVVTDAQFNQIMRGEKSAKEVHPEALAKAEQVDQVSETKPNPSTPDQRQDVPSPPPPPPPPPLPPVRQAEPPQPPDPAPPPPPVAVLPPPRPEPPQPEKTPAPPVPTPPVRDVEADPVAPAPKPEPKPVPKPVAKPVPLPPRPDLAKLHDVRPPPKPRPAEKPKLDLLAKLMEEQPADPKPVAKTSPSRAKPAKETSDQGKFDPTDISRLLSKEAPAQKPSTGRALSRVASLGSPTANAPKMAPSMWAGLDGLLEDQYRQCWSYLGLGGGQKYIPQVRVVYSPSGGLESEPVLINPPSDPSMRSLADSALRAVRRCNPLKIPDAYAPYYDQWRGRVLRFDPDEMAG